MMQAEKFLRDLEHKNRRVNAMAETADQYIRKARLAGVMDDKTIKTFIDMSSALRIESVALQAEIERMRAITKHIDAEDEKLFIELRYFNRLKMASIARSMNCSEANAYRLQRRVIRDVQRVLDAGLVSMDG